MADSKLSVLSSASLPLPGNAQFYVVVGGVSYKTTLADILDNAGDFLPRVDTQADLPVTIGDPAVDALYLVRSSTGVWPLTRKPKGIWRRIANAGALADWEYWGDEQALADMFGSYQPLDSDLSAIAAVAPANDDVLQRKAGAWTNRTMAQLKTDLAVSWSDVSGKPTTFAPIIGAGAGDAVAGNDSRLTDARTPTTHTHPQSEVTNLVTDLAGKAATSHTHAYSSLTSIPSTFAPVIGAGPGDAVAGNDSRLTDARTPTAHASSHTSGSDVIQDATSSQKGLATATQITKLDAIDAKASAKKVITLVIDGGGSVITTGVKSYLRIPWSCTITKSTVLADVSGAVVIDVWKDTYANFPPLVADTITASAKPTLSSAQKSEDATLTGWTTSISAGDVMGFNVDSAATVKRVVLELEVTLT